MRRALRMTLRGESGGESRWVVYPGKHVYSLRARVDVFMLDMINACIIPFWTLGA